MFLFIKLRVVSPPPPFPPVSQPYSKQGLIKDYTYFSVAFLASILCFAYYGYSFDLRLVVSICCFFHDSLLSIKGPRYLAHSFCFSCSWSTKISNLVWGWLPTLNNNKFDFDTFKSKFICSQPIGNIV